MQINLYINKQRLSSVPYSYDWSEDKISVYCGETCAALLNLNKIIRCDEAVCYNDSMCLNPVHTNVLH